MEIVQTYGRKKTATAIAHCKHGKGLMKINGSPLDIVKPDVLRLKVVEVINALGSFETTKNYRSESEDPIKRFDIKVFVHGGGQVSQIYAIRQAIAKALLAFYGKFVDVESKYALKEFLTAFDRTLLVS